MKKGIKVFEILSIKRGNNSYYGNPSYYLGLSDENNNIYYAKTASNAAIAYEINQSWVGTQKALCYHITSKGSMVIEYHEKNKDILLQRQLYDIENQVNQIDATLSSVRYLLDETYKIMGVKNE